MSKKATPPRFWLLQWATAALFLGRAWQHLRWDAPYRTLLWDESLMKGFVESVLGMSWSDYVTSSSLDQGIQIFIKIIGGYLVLAAVAVFLLQLLPRLAKWIIGIGGFILLLVSYLYFKEHFQQAGLFIEYTLQWGTPFLLLYAFGSDRWTKRWQFLAVLATALTFVGHGLYAVGWYPRPGHFVQMTLTITGMSEPNCVLFLQIAGVLDFIAALGLFIPVHRIRMISAAYMLGWGMATTAARLWANWVPAFWLNTLEQWIHEVVYRFPHFLLPLILLLTWYRVWQQRPVKTSERLQDSERFY